MSRQLVGVIAPAVLALTSVINPTLAKPPAEGSLLVSNNNELQEFTYDGVFVRSFAVPYPGGRPGTETTRDLTVDRDGRINVFNGTFQPYLSVLNPRTGQWSHFSAVGWAIVNNVSYGGIATWGGDVYVGDQALDNTEGIYRFNMDRGYTSEQFEGPGGYIDVVTGLNGLLYGLRSDETNVDERDPGNLVIRRTIALEEAVRAVAINADGEIYGASWDGVLYQFEPNGTRLRTMDTGLTWMIDIDLSTAGRVVVGSGFGDIILTDKSFNPATVFNTGFGSAFVAIVPECVTLIVPTLYAGEFVDVMVTDAEPGSLVVVRCAVRTGPPVFQRFDAFCFESELRPWRGLATFGYGIADENGHLLLGRPIPDLPGMTVYFQAVQNGTCPNACDSLLIRRTIE